MTNLSEIDDETRLTPEHYLAVRSDGLTFGHCVIEAAGTPELVTEFDRLWGSSLMGHKEPINQLIDTATGKTDADIQAFLRFVWNCIFIRVEAEKP